MDYFVPPKAELIRGIDLPQQIRQTTILMTSFEWVLFNYYTWFDEVTALILFLMKCTHKQRLFHLRNWNIFKNTNFTHSHHLSVKTDKLISSSKWIWNQNKTPSCECECVWNQVHAFLWFNADRGRVMLLLLRRKKEKLY